MANKRQPDLDRALDDLHEDLLNKIYDAVDKVGLKYKDPDAQRVIESWFGSDIYDSYLEYVGEGEL